MTRRSSEADSAVPGSGRAAGRSASGAPSDLLPDPAIPPVSPAPPVDLVDLGRVEGPFGVQGWIRIRLFGGLRDSVLLGTRQWWWRPAAGASRLLKVRQCRVHGDGLVAALEGCEDRDQALALKAGMLGVSRAVFPPQAEDEYYWVDLIGCAVWTPARIALGEIRSVEEFGADAVLRVAGPDGVERLIPFVGAIVVGVDLPAREVVVDWGLDY